jgi:hypothetical protein
MWQWWFFTCVSIFLFIARNTKNPKMSFNRQPNMFFGKIISCTCDLHLKLNILNPLNIIVFPNHFKKKSFALQPFPSKFHNHESFVWFGYSSSSSNGHVFSQNGTCFHCIKSLKSIVWLYAFILIFFQKKFKYLI